MLDTATSTVLDYLVSLGWNYKITNRDSEKYKGPCPVGKHSGDDVDPKFSIHANQIAFSCFKCGFSGGGLRSLKEQMGQDYEPRVLMPVPPKKAAKTKHTGFQGATVRQLCDAKGIDYEYAKSTLEWKDTTYGRGKTPAVEMPYRDLDGGYLPSRFRVGISNGTRILSSKGSGVMPYGLQNISQCRAGNYVICEEGETDWATLDEMGYNAIGIPGVNTFKPEWTVYLNGIKTVYIWQESGGTPDRRGRTPGQQMVHRISEYRGEVFVLEAPPEGKDPCELRQKLGVDAFAELLDQMMIDAKPYNAVELEAAERRANNPSKPTAIHTHHKSTAETDRYEDPDDSPSPTYTIGSALEKRHGCGHAHHQANKTARNIGKPVNLTTLVYLHRQAIAEQSAKKAEFYSLSQQGVKLLDFCDMCIYMDDPRFIASHDTMVNLVSGALGMVDLSGTPVPAYVAVVDCGRETYMNCDVHGAAWGGSHKCYQGFCPNCGTQASSQAAKVAMPALEGSAQYYHVVFETRNELPENLDHWGPIFGKKIDTWQKTIGKVGLWKASKGRLYSRSHATYYAVENGKRIAITTWKVMFHEVEEGSLDKTVAKIAKAMDANIIDEKRWQSGKTAALQIVSDFMMHFVGISDSLSKSDQDKLFLAHHNSTRGRHVFQAFGLLRKLITELPAPEPQRCPEPGCGLKLTEVLVPLNTSGKVGRKHGLYDKRN